VAHIEPVGEHCNYNLPQQCHYKDAVIFVHGIYGGKDSFTHKAPRFDWPSKLPRKINDHNIDVFKLIYETEMVSWARKGNPSFDEVAEAVSNALKPIRIAGYNSIGFIAHSLGGNVVSTYIHTVKTKLGHPQRSQNAFIITLATPVLGSQIADIAADLKSALFMSDPLLDALKQNNTYLTMLEQFREEEDEKSHRYICRPVDLHAAVEQKYLGPLLIVDDNSAALPISKLVKSPIVGFPLDHIAISKPDSEGSAVYRWVLARIEEEYARIATWDVAHERFPPARRLCELTDFIPE
jgi:hypothetical protein